MNSQVFIFISSGRDMMLPIWCLFWGTGNDREEKLPQQALALTGSHWCICSQTVTLQPVSHMSLTQFTTEESSPGGFLSFPFIAGWIGWKSLSPSFCKPSKRDHWGCCSVLGFGRRIFSSPVCFHLLLSALGITALFPFSCLLLNPSWWTSWPHDCVEWSQKGCAVGCLWGLQLLPQALPFFCLKNRKHNVSFYVSLSLHL